MIAALLAAVSVASATVPPSTDEFWSQMRREIDASAVSFRPMTHGTTAFVPLARMDITIDRLGTWLSGPQLHPARLEAHFWTDASGVRHALPGARPLADCGTEPCSSRIAVRGPITERWLTSEAGLSHQFLLPGTGTLEIAADGRPVRVTADHILFGHRQAVQWSIVEAYDSVGPVPVQVDMNTGGWMITIGPATGAVLLQTRIDRPEQVWCGGVGNARLGTHLVSGDIDGDARPELIAGDNRFGGSEPYEGAVFGWTTGPTPRTIWSYRSGQPRTYFHQADIAGDIDGDGFVDLIAGNPGRFGPHGIAGQVLWFRGGPGGPSDVPTGAYGFHQAGARFGGAVAASGDVDVDGFADIIVGAPFFEDQHGFQGQVLWFRGGPEGLAPTAAWSRIGTEGQHLGTAVAGIGDIDNDGHPDMMAAGEHAEVYRGSPLGPQDPLWRVSGNPGWSLLGSFDANGDAYADVIIADGWLEGDGRLRLFLGSSHGLEPHPHWSWSRPNVQLGAALSAGDLNGDGQMDLVASAPRWPDGGAVLVFAGRPEGLSLEPIQIHTCGTTPCEMGRGLSVMDRRGDGTYEIIAGAPEIVPGGALLQLPNPRNDSTSQLRETKHR